MKNSKKTLKMLIICIIGILVVALVNTFKKEGDPYESTQKLYQHIEKEDLLNNPAEDGDSYYIYFYKEGCPCCKEVEDDIKEYVSGHSTMYFVNMDEKSKEKDEYGKTKRYEIKKADKEYLKTNKKARKGYVYASLETPNINYYTLTPEDEVTIAGVPMLLHVKDNKVDKFYFDSVEIKPALEKLIKD